MSDTQLPAPTSDRDEVQYLRMDASDVLGEVQECALDLFNLARELRTKMHTLFQAEVAYEGKRCAGHTLTDCPNLRDHFSTMSWEQ